MDEQYLFNNAKYNLGNGKNKVLELVKQYNKIVDDKLKNKNTSMDVYRTLLIYMMKKADTLEKMQPKSDNDLWKERRIANAFEIRKRILEGYENIFNTKLTVDMNSYSEVKGISDAIYDKEKAIWEKGEMHQLTEKFKKDVTEKFCEDNEYVYTILANEPEAKKLIKTRNRENEFMNEIVDAHFATADYNGMIGYICRAVNGNGFHGSFKNEKYCCEYPDNPFADIDKQDDSDKIKLRRNVNVLLTDASLYEPVFDFAIDKNGKIGFRFSGEMIARAPDELDYKKIEVKYLDRSILKQVNFSTRSKDNNVIDLNKEYSNEEEQEIVELY